MLSNIGANKYMKKATNILLDVLIFIFGIILLISLYNVVQVKILGNDYSSFFGYTMFEVQTGSMEPEISAGDWIIVKEQKSFNLDDIVTFKQDGNFITHRVIEKYSETYITKGDANNKEDDPIGTEQIVGEVVTIIPLFGVFRNTLFNPYVLIALIITVYIFNTKELKKGGFNKVIKKIKYLFNQIKNKFSNQKEEEEFFKDNTTKSFENVASQPKFTDYEEKLEDHTKFDVDEENEIEEEKIIDDYDKEDELSKTMFFRMIEVDEDKDLVSEKSFEEEIEKPNDFNDRPIITGDEPLGNEPARSAEKGQTIKERFAESQKEEVINTIEEETEENLPLEMNINEETVDEVVEEKVDIPVSNDSFIISTDDEDYEMPEVEEEIVEQPEIVEKTVEEEPIKEKEKKNDEEEAKFTLEMIFNKPENKRSKNIIARTMAIKEEEINKTIDLIFGESKILTNEASIKKALIKSYLESKYYNIFSEKVAALETRKAAAKKPRYAVLNSTTVISEKNGFSKSYAARIKKLITRVSYALEEDSAKLASVYSGNDKSYEEKLIKYSSLILLISKLEYLVDLDINMRNKKILYTKEIIKFIHDYDIENDNIEYTVKEIIHSQKHYRSASKYFLDRLNTEMFELIYHSFKTEKAKFLLDLKHNINFSQVYSDKVVTKAYMEGIVAEDKLNVLLTLLQARLSHDMLTGEFVNEYMVMIPNSLCLKDAKFERLFKQNNEEYAKKNIVYLINYDLFMKKAASIKNLRKNGFRIAMYINDETKFASKNKTGIALAEYIFIDKGTNKIIELEKVVFDNFKNKIIKDDIESKLIINREEK